MFILSTNNFVFIFSSLKYHIFYSILYFSFAPLYLTRIFLALIDIPNLHSKHHSIMDNTFVFFFDHLTSRLHDFQLDHPRLKIEFTKSIYFSQVVVFRFCTLPVIFSHYFQFLNNDILLNFVTQVKCHLTFTIESQEMVLNEWLGRLKSD